jgi:hypothetical protein
MSGSGFTTLASWSDFVSAKGRIAAPVLLVLVALTLFAWWKHEENRRQLRSIAEQVYDYAGYGEELPDGGSYRRDTYPFGVCASLDDWLGAYGIGVGGTRERKSGAEPIAQALLADGWRVERWVWDGGGYDRFQILGRRGSTTLDVSFGSQDIRIGAFDGPCGSIVEPAAPPDWTNPVRVDRFGG